MSAAISEAARAAHAALRSVCFDRLRARIDASEALLDDYLKFIVCKAASKDYFASLISCPPEVDAIWHTHLLDTVNYHEMCEAILPTGRFIHHNPDGGQDKAARSERRKRGIALYETFFGDVPAYWKSACAHASHKRPAAADAGGSASRARHGVGGMRIFFKTLTGMNITLEVDSSDSIAQVAEKLRGEAGIPPDEEMWFLFAGRRLEGIPERRQPMVNSLRQKTNAQLRKELRAKGLKSTGQKAALVDRMAEAMLDEDRREKSKHTLSYHNIPKDATIHVLLRLRGC